MDGWANAVFPLSDTEPKIGVKPEQMRPKDHVGSPGDADGYRAHGEGVVLHRGHRPSREAQTRTTPIAVTVVRPGLKSGLFQNTQAKSLGEVADGEKLHRSASE